MSPEYVFFREAMAEALSKYGKERVPWLYCVYQTLREIAQASPDSLCCSESDFKSIVEGVGSGELGFTPEHILATGCQANFFSVDKQGVKPRIRLLGRIASVTRERLSP